MKNVAKLALFLSISFIGVLLLSSAAALLQDWADAVLLFPPEGGISGSIAGYLRASIPAAFYLSILFALTYAARRRVAYPAAFILILVFILALSGGAFLALENLGSMGFTAKAARLPADPAKPGFILHRGALSGYQTVFLEDPYKSSGAVVNLTQGQSLTYQSQGALYGKTKLPFFTEKTGIFNSIAKDLERSSAVFNVWFKNGVLSYGVYAGSLAVFLLSLGCLFNISFWPLANLFLGALIYRCILAMENFLNQNNIHDMLSSFAGKFIHHSLINPVIFYILSILILLYSGLIYLARGRGRDG